MKPPKIRLDDLLVTRGLCPTRNQAKALIMAGKVRSGTTVLDKPGRAYAADMELSLVAPRPFVSRGGEKLSAFLTEYPIAVKGRTVLDIGASTGGFADCLLQVGAASAVCVDVGFGQLAVKIRDDPRVTVKERTNARYLTAEVLPTAPFDIIVMDLSFISLRKVLPAAWPLLKTAGHLIALVKPQFEASRREADRGRGIIRDRDVHRRVLQEIRQFSRLHLDCAREYGVAESRVPGAGGNVEFFIGLTRGATSRT